MNRLLIMGIKNPTMGTIMFTHDFKHLYYEKNGGKITFSLLKDLVRLIRGEPLPYIIGTIPFNGAIIDLSYRPLIPRSETEFWTERAIEMMKKESKKTPQILDIFSGSGCIGIAIRIKIPESSVTFADIDKNALNQIKKNIVLNALNTKNTRIVESDIFEKVIGRFDYIYANPPYIPKGSKQVARSVTRWEPHHALFAHKEGMAIIEDFLANVSEYIHPGGKVFMEFDTPQKEAVEIIAKKIKGGRYEFWKDHYGAWRVLVLSF